MMFNEEFQLYYSWTMNFQEFNSWVYHKIETLGEDEFNKKYSTFESVYKEYTDMLKGY